MPGIFSKKTNPKKIPIVFFGTSSFAETILDLLINEKYSVSAVVTRADKPKGRKRESVASHVKQLAERHSLPILQPEKFDAAASAEIKHYKPRIIIVAEYGKIIPKTILEIPKFGCINVHASLLPKYRGASPVQNAILNGETQTGITIMLMDEGMDTGSILTQQSIAIDPDEIFPDLMKRLAHAGAALLTETLPKWARDAIAPKKQDAKKATYCQLIEKQDGQVFWNKQTVEIYNMYRALTPWPGIFCFIRIGETLKRLKLLQIRPAPDTSQPPSHGKVGEVFTQKSGVFVRTADSAIEIKKLQLEGKNPLEIEEFVRGYQPLIGAVLQ